MSKRISLFLSQWRALLLSWACSKDKKQATQKWDREELFPHLPFPCPLTALQGSVFKKGEEVSRSGQSSFPHEDGLAHLHGGIIKKLKQTY